MADLVIKNDPKDIVLVKITENKEEYGTILPKHEIHKGEVYAFRITKVTKTETERIADFELVKIQETI